MSAQLEKRLEPFNYFKIDLFDTATDLMGNSPAVSGRTKYLQLFNKLDELKSGHEEYYIEANGDFSSGYYNSDRAVSTGIILEKVHLDSLKLSRELPREYDLHLRNGLVIARIRWLGLGNPSILTSEQEQLATSPIS